MKRRGLFGGLFAAPLLPAVTPTRPKNMKCILTVHIDDGEIRQMMERVRIDVIKNTVERLTIPPSDLVRDLSGLR